MTEWTDETLPTDLSLEERLVQEVADWTHLEERSEQEAVGHDQAAGYERKAAARFRKVRQEYEALLALHRAHRASVGQD